MEDYRKNGILYCGKCNTPKECRVSVFGAERMVACMCECQQEEQERIDAEYRKKEQDILIQNMRAAGFPDPKVRRATFEKDDGKNPELTKLCKNYVAKFGEPKEQSGLLLYGTVGTGKSFMSACIVNELIEQGYPCLATSFSRLVNTLQGMFEGKQDYIDRLSSYDLLFIDDLGAERNTEYMNEMIYNIIDARYRSGKPLIVTTNLTGAELKSTAEIEKNRIYSRILEMCFPHEVKGTDRRKEKLKTNYNGMKQFYEI